MRRRRPGLRAQFVIALLATSALTLVAAVATLVPPLEHRLATDRLRDMRELARTADLGLARLPPSDLRPGSKRQEAVSAPSWRDAWAAAWRSSTRTASSWPTPIPSAPSRARRRPSGSSTPASPARATCATR